MSFTSLIFLFLFLPLALILYRFLYQKPKAANILLLVLSLLFYAWDGIRNVILLIIVVAWCWASGLEMSKLKENSKERKLTMIISVSLPVLILVFYKYFPIVAPSVNAGFPLGLSFYIFSAISYLADIYMMKAAACTSILDTGLYLGFFGKVSMGPITQYHTFAPQISHRKITRSELGRGAMEIITGLTKKVIIADQLAVVFAALAGDNSFLGSWIMMLAYTFQLYFDFSGYSDMAIGISRLFGFNLPANFNHPYTAVSIQDFWRRWHISLSQWFRDYVYIPLGGSRCSDLKYIRNLFVVWILTGIWHGSTWTFVIWGVYYALLLMAEKYVFKDMLPKIPHPVRVIGTFLLVLFGWVFFTQPTLAGALSVFKGLFLLSGSFATDLAWYQLASSWILMAIAIFFCAPRAHLYDLICSRIGGRKGYLVAGAGYILLFAVCVMLIMMSTSQTFLYAQF
ncbi:MAG: MBOAT family protein [Erysipelotrichaceae bacterium]|nr:MBOAT family protein [Erysipelotrichaceae bacterium]